MARQHSGHDRIKKRVRPKDRPFTVALYILRAKQVGLTFDELNTMSFGFVMDILTELSNDGYDYPIKATQGDIDHFFG